VVEGHGYALRLEDPLGPTFSITSITRQIVKAIMSTLTSATSGEASFPEALLNIFSVKAFSVLSLSRRLAHKAI